MAKNKITERVTENHVFFWGGPFSNWYPCAFTAEIDGEKVEFSNTEQYFMYMKAKLFNDKENQEKILMFGADPKMAKSLGREVRNYNDKVWDEKRYGVMKDANILKFTQNEDLKELILSDKFKGKHFCEGSPIDRIWGCGVHWEEASDDESTWKGQNLLGKCLDEVRSAIIDKEG